MFQETQLTEAKAESLTYIKEGKGEGEEGKEKNQFLFGKCHDETNALLSNFKKLMLL